MTAAARWRFRPGLASSCVTILLFPALISLGLWQLDRAQQKRALFERYQLNRAAPAATWDGGALTAGLQSGRAITATGHYLQPTFLLDNRFREGQAGYEILSPFEVAGGRHLMVARGWIAMGADRSRIPEIRLSSEQVTLQGRLGNPPVSGIRLGQSDAVERLSATVFRAQRAEPEIFSKALGFGVPATLLYLNPDAASAYDRHWPVPAGEMSRHQAYAVQWFVMSAVLLLLYIKINVRRAL